MTIRVVSIISRMNVGGPAVLISELLTNLPPVEFKHTLITGHCEANEIDFLENHHLESEVIYLDKVQRSLLPIKDLRSFFELYVLLKKLNPDVVHTHTSKAGVLGRLAAKLAVPGALIIHTYHGHLLYGYFSPLITKMIIFLERMLSQISNVLIAVTQQVRDDLLNAGIGSANKWIVIRPGLSIPSTLPKAIFRKKFDIPDSTFVIAWIGRFTDIKDPMLALRTIEKLPTAIRSNVQLIMAGDGELLTKCRQYADQKQLSVIFLGWCEDISPLLFDSDLLLMSSKSEGMPVVIVEAAIRQVPTLSTDVGGVGEFIKDSVTGYLAETPDELVENLKKILSDRAELERIAMNSKNLALKEFNIELFIKKHLELYRAKKS